MCEPRTNTGFRCIRNLIIFFPKKVKHVHLGRLCRFSLFRSRDSSRSLGGGSGRRLGLDLLLGSSLGSTIARATRSGITSCSGTTSSDCNHTVSSTCAPTAATRHSWRSIISPIATRSFGFSIGFRVNFVFLPVILLFLAVVGTSGALSRLFGIVGRFVTRCSVAEWVGSRYPRSRLLLRRRRSIILDGYLILHALSHPLGLFLIDIKLSSPHTTAVAVIPSIAVSGARRGIARGLRTRLRHINADGLVAERLVQVEGIFERFGVLKVDKEHPHAVCVLVVDDPNPLHQDGAILIVMEVVANIVIRHVESNTRL
mmetsp:Transcript_81686/g.119702  ORF Transcript_81686/g.119702 Transcript_81686/m.119702 type:complete len:314 (+) Transcript_81686:240-1181(+)